MKKLLLLVIVVLNFSVLPSFAKDDVIIDRITQSEAEQLNLTIPDDVPPGFHSIEIEVYDDKGTIVKKEVPFCKNLAGEIHWDNQCPDVLAAQEAKAIDPITNPGKLKAYDPLSDPNKTKDLQLAALAALAAIGATKKNEKKEEDQEEDVEGVKAGDLKLVHENPGAGDLRQTWQNQYSNRTDSFFIGLARWTNKFSPLLTRTIQDGNTLRAPLGVWAFSLYPVAVVLGAIGSCQVSGNAIPPRVAIILAIIGVAVFDAFAGFTAGFVFVLGTLFTGHLGTRSEYLTTLGILTLFFAPALLASSFRPLRRAIKNSDDVWERLTDLALSTVLTYWAISKMVGAMNGLAHLELPITNHSQQISIFAASLIVLRFIVEEIISKLYPVRLKSLHVEKRELRPVDQVISLELKIYFFVMLAMPFVGYNLQLLLGMIIFALPTISGLIFEDKLPKKKLYLPKGALKTIVMIFVMAAASKAIEGSFDHKETFLKWNFVVMALPGLVLHYVDAFTDSPGDDWKKSPAGRAVYRVGGVIVFVLIVIMVKGVDLASWLIK